MDQSASRNDNMGTDPLGDMFSRMFDQMQPQEPTNMTSTTDTDVARLEEEKRELNRQISELRSKNSTLSSRNQELQSTNQQLLSTNRTLRKQLSELNETTKLLGEIKKRERVCAEKEERCNHILNRQAALESREAKLQSDRTRFDSEREQLYKSIAEQVSQEVERERQRLGEDNDRRCEKAKRILFALCVGVCSFAVPMPVIVMAADGISSRPHCPSGFTRANNSLPRLVNGLATLMRGLAKSFPDGGMGRSPSSSCCSFSSPCAQYHCS